MNIKLNETRKHLNYKKLVSVLKTKRDLKIAEKTKIKKSLVTWGDNEEYIRRPLLLKQEEEYELEGYS